jgi:hypothetical protein
MGGLSICPTGQLIRIVDPAPRDANFGSRLRSGNAADLKPDETGGRMRIDGGEVKSV